MVVDPLEADSAIEATAQLRDRMTFDWTGKRGVGPPLFYTQLLLLEVMANGVRLSVCSTPALPQD